jgi:hypothetical protein
MISSEVQRTLVKSPPELWAELSDPAALARHLGELGEIQIVRTEPERTVEWAAENTTGVVSIKPSGWGTKVTLSVTRALSGPQPEDLGAPAESTSEESQPLTDPPLEATAERDPEPEVQAAVKDEAPAETDTAEPIAAEPAVEPEPRRGFFARLFSRRRQSTPAARPAEAVEAAVSAKPVADVESVAPAEPVVAAKPDAPAEPVVAAKPDAPAEPVADIEPVAAEPDAFAAVTQALAPASIAATNPFVAPAAPASAPAPAADISAELMAAEEVAAAEVSAEVTAEEVTAVLTAVLDRLGAAHHRPFSRA